MSRNPSFWWICKRIPLLSLWPKTCSHRPKTWETINSQTKSLRWPVKRITWLQLILTVYIGLSFPVLNSHHRDYYFFAFPWARGSIQTLICNYCLEGGQPNVYMLRINPCHPRSFCECQQDDIVSRMGCVASVIHSTSSNYYISTTWKSRQESPSRKSHTTLGRPSQATKYIHSMYERSWHVSSSKISNGSATWCM